MTPETWILPELWREIKTYLFHDIKTQGRHLKNKPFIKTYNNVIESIPKKYTEKGNTFIKIVYNSATKNFRIVKFIYKIPTPQSIKTNNDQYNLVIEITPLIQIYTKPLIVRRDYELDVQIR